MSSQDEIPRAEKILIKTYIAPHILELIRPIDQETILKHFNEKRMIDEVLETKHIKSLRGMLRYIPDIIKIPMLEKAKREEYIDFFIDEVLSEKRPDLYLLIKYVKGLREYIIENIRRLIELLEPKPQYTL